MGQRWGWETMDVLRDGSPARAGRGAGAVLAATLVGRAALLPGSSCKVARLELPRSRRTMVQKEQMRRAGWLFGSLVW